MMTRFACVRPAQPRCSRIAANASRKRAVSCTAAWASRAEAGKVALVSGSWVNVFLDEVCAFPLGAHDDQVDTISGGVQMLSSGVVSTMRNPWT